MNQHVADQSAHRAIFVASQRMRHLVLTKEQRKLVRNYLRGGQLEKDGQEHHWKTVGHRFRFLGDLKRRRLCLTVDAGIGKTTAVRQAQIARQHFHPDHLAIRCELTDLPATWGGLLDEKRQIKLEGEDQIQLLDPLLIELASHVLRQAHQNKLLIGPPPDKHHIEMWIRSMIKAGRCTLIVDALDQVGKNAGNQKTTALRQFLDIYPEIHCLVAGRPYAIQNYWQLFSSGGEASDWDFALLEVFSTEQVREYIGEELYQLTRDAEADALFVPRSLEVLRRLDPQDLKTVRTASDIYWRSVDATLGQDIEVLRNKKQLSLRKSEIIELFAAVAFEMVSAKDGPVLEIARSQFDDFARRIFRKHGHAFQWTAEQLRDKLDELATINSQYIDFAFLDTDEIRDLRWRNATLRDFFAALWMVRSGTNEDRQWLRKCDRSKRSSHYELLKMLCGMPRGAFVATEGRQDYDYYLQAIQPFFDRRERTASTEMIYRCWPALLGLAGIPVRDEQGRVLSMEQRTALAQREARRWVDSGQSLDAAENLARRLLLSFLVEYPALQEFNLSTLLKSWMAWRRAPWTIARKFEAQFRQIPAQPTATLTFWYGDDRQKREIPARFRLSACTVTNELYRLFDAKHAAGHSDYGKYSPSAQGPAIYLQWYDAWCVATWFHGRLPSELEWEYACRARPGTEGVPYYKWHFGDEEAELEKYAWYFKYAKGHAHPVGEKLPNAFGLYDMHGNVREWARDWYDADRTLRVSRGGSFRVSADYSRCSIRSGDDPTIAGSSNGCRIARAVF